MAKLVAINENMETRLILYSVKKTAFFPKFIMEIFRE